MITIINEDNVVCFDEIGWGDTIFRGLDLAKDLFANHLSAIRRVEFISVDRVIVVRLEKEQNHRFMEIDYWFHDIDFDFLNFICHIPKFRIPVKRFFIRARYSSFSTQDYPMLAATLLGNNNEC